MMYEGQKVRLREYRKEDIPLRVKYINDPEIAANLTPDVPYPITQYEEEKWFESITSVSDTYKFAIETLSDNKFIGGCNITNVDWKNSVATVGIFIGGRENRGKGYGSDVVRVIQEFIFMSMNINKIRLTVYSFNRTAIKCYKKCGFRIEGVLRNEIYSDGKYFDKIAMGILKAEYIANKALLEMNKIGLIKVT